MFFRAPLSSLASAALWTYAQATYLNSDLSFGHNDKISPNLRAIPNFHLMGKPDPPEILSNKVVLTPPAPGNQRGAAWSEKQLLHSWWSADIDFRATGPERGGGNLQIWYAANGKDTVGTSSIYTAGRFDGLALVVDQYAGSGGFIRGFLNDGTLEYKSHHSVDSLAFGHCSYSYRNLGRPSRIAIKQSPSTFRVDVDGKLCFESDKVRLPLGYNFGITAASAENPDSFEVFKFVVTTESHTPDMADPNPPAAQQAGQQFAAVGNEQAGQAQAPVSNQSPNDGTIPSFSDPPEVPASTIIDSAAQFADLHNRLQAMMKHISALNRDISHFQSSSTSRSSKLDEQISSLQREVAGLSLLKSMDKKLDEIRQDVRQTKSDLHNALDRKVEGIRQEVRSTHNTMLGRMEERAVGVLGYVLVVVGSQALTVVAYLVYKRRKNGGSKKYL